MTTMEPEVQTGTASGVSSSTEPSANNDTVRNENNNKMETETTAPGVSSNASTGDAQSVNFKVNQKILAKHGPLMYAAKILAMDPDKGYLIHYDRWSKNWDEWVEVDRLFEDNDANRALLLQLQKETMEASTKRSAPATTGSNKRKRDATNGTDDPEDDKEENDKLDDPPPVRINLSDDLKSHVVRDWENLTQKNKICNLPKPADKSVSKILEDFKASKKKVAVFAQICDGLAVYFDRALPTILLYRVERTQYEKLRAENPDKRNCDMYGGEHLLRLFVRLPHLLANTDLDDVETKQLCARLQDLIRFLSKESPKYFTDNDDAYVPFASPSSQESTTTTAF